MQHIIKKQIINLFVPRKLNAFTMQQSVSMHYYKHILPIIEELFDELSDDEETVSIDLLDIDLGYISSADMQKPDWDESMLSGIREQLKKKIISIKEEARIERNMFTVCRQWLFYMERGYLPWNTMGLSADWYRQVLESFAVDFAKVSELRKLITTSATALRRMVYQHEEGYLVSLIEILTSQHQGKLIQEISMLDMYLDNGGENYPRTALWEHALKTSAEMSNRSTGQLVDSMVMAFAGGKPIKGNISMLKDSMILPALLKMTGHSVSTADHKNDLVVDKTRELVEDIFVQNAGQVLMHPFLHQLFRSIDLVSEGRFRTSYDQQKALYLLHYLATGRLVAEEYELVVPKLLCNLPLGEPVMKNIELMPGEIEQCDHMLGSLVEHWAVLKSTSIDGLREGFLLRNGKLSRKNDQFIVHVESSTIDVLLDRLPWNLSMIKLPWMDELLRVDWR